MFTEGITPIGDGLLDIDEERLKGILVPHDINEIYDVEQTPFARGKFAAVRRAIHKNSGVHFAAKFLKRRRRAQSSDKEIKHEIAVLMLCDGAENIVKLNAVHESRSDTALLLELATGGELQTFLDNEECLSEIQARICMREVLKALLFLHKRSIAHLDLKPQNILLTGERIEDGLKLCDFGISRVVAEGTNVREIVGTPDYVAPEVLQYEPLSLLTDIWSVGVLAYVLLSGFSPFGGETKQETFLNISQCSLTFPDKLFGGVSAAAIDFIRRALRIKPNDRMTAAGCLEHTWLKDECSIDRPIFGNRSKQSAADVDDDDDDDDDDDEDCEDRDESIDEDEISAEEANGMIGNKMDSSDIEQETQQIRSNGKAHNNSINATNGTASKYNGTKSLAATTTTTTTTAVLTVPAARGSTMPLCNMQTQPARRHSSDSNKENTFLTTKKIAPAISAHAVKKPTAIATSTATIIIAASDISASASSNIVATITLPNSSSNCNDKSGTAAAQCLFPDAPTTPKVIRKAPTTDTSPTSVKALVKKFQLESNNGERYAHLKETQANQQPPHQHNHHHANGFSNKKPTTTTTATSLSTTNGVLNGKASEKCTNDEQNKKFFHATASSSSSSNNHHNISISNNNNNHISNKHTASSSRRFSEPITAVHKKLPSSPTPSAATLVSSTSPTMGGQSSANSVSYKSNCVLCLTCGGSNIATATGCGHSAATATMTATACNGSSNITTTSAANGSSSTAATAILLSNHQQLQHHHNNTHAHHHHHHLHHHHVAKSAANNLSMDQGIIC